MHIPQTEVILRHEGVELVRQSLPPGEYIIGRGTDADIRGETPLLSRRHAQLTINYDHIIVEDLGSSNGTFVAEQPITDATRVFPNQHVRLGSVTLEVRRQRATGSPEVSLAPAQATVRRLLPDEVLAEKRYSIGTQVARGGMGAILEARQTALQRSVAMKVMLDSADEPDVLRFIEEAQITSQIEHPNIVPVHELGVDEQDQLFYTMKMVRGITLKKVLELIATGAEATVRKYSLIPLLTIFQKVCDAVAFAHSKGVIHRDLKPENIMLGDYGEVLVMDWGLAKIVGRRDFGSSSQDVARSVVMSARAGSGELGSTMAGSIMGTPQYMSPEQARGEVESLDALTDIYALGAILFHLLHLRAPVTGIDAMEIVEKVQRGEIEWRDVSGRAPAATKIVSHLPGGRIPDSLLAVCRKALALDRAARYQHVAELQADLTAYQSGFATGAEKAGAWKQIKLLIRRNKAASIGAAAVLLVGATLGTKAILEGRRAEREAASAKSTLADLRRTAPTFAEQAKVQLDAGKPTEALEKIGYAVQLAPENTAYRVFRADVLQSSQQLVAAAEEYRHVLALQPDHPGAKANLSLCERWLQENGAGELKREVQMQLVDALLAQNRKVEAAPLALVLGKGQDAVETALRARLKEYQSQIGWNEDRVARLPNGGFKVSLEGLKLGDLSILRGLPIDDLNLSGNGVSDLRGVAGLSVTTLALGHNRISDVEPLRGMKLTRLYLNNNPLTDISPLRGMHLRELSLADTGVTDVSPLEGMPLSFLSLRKGHMRDLAVLKGMPLRHLDINYSEITDLSPLRGSSLRVLEAFVDGLEFSALSECRELEEVSIKKASASIAILERLPKLQRIVLGSGTPPLSKAQLLEIYRNSSAMVEQVRAVLRKISPKLKPEAVEMFDAQGVRLNLQLHPEVSDLSPLRGLPIAFLDLAHTTVKDLSPLRGMPLVWLSIAPSKVTDVSPLVDCRKLESLMLPPGTGNVEVLRGHPGLRYLSDSRFDDGKFRAGHTTEEFWAEYDARRAAAK